MANLIRMATRDDAEACLRIYEPIIRETSISFETEVPSVEDMRGRISDYLGYAPWICYEEDGVVVGYAYGSRFRPRAAYRWSVEGSVYLALDSRGKGVGMALAGLLSELLRLQGFQVLIGGIALPNPASEGLVEKLGMERMGVLPRVGFKFSEWHDLALWQMELNEPSVNPSEPLSVVECAGTPGWDAAFAGANELLG